MKVPPLCAHPRWVIFCTLALALALPSCAGDNEDSPASVDAAPMMQGDGAATEGTRQAALQSIASNVYRSTFTAFLDSAETLASAVSVWNEAPEPENVEASRTAWLDAMTVWQRAELMQVGPAGIADRRIGGEDLREKIYSFPAVNPCRIDQVLANQSYTQDGWIDGALYHVQGLDALEYLLFNESLSNECPAAVRLNRDGEWAPLENDPAELWSRRTALAKLIAEQLVIHAQALNRTWTEGSEFATAFATGGAPFGSVKTSLDQVFAGMFYVDKFIKDLKLGKPAGITPDCEADICPAAVESRFAQISKESLLANMEGFRHLFIGGQDEAAIGFDDLLEAEGAAELSRTILDKITAATDALAAIDGTLSTALSTNPESVRAAHAAVRAITEDLKTQFVTVLNLSVPQEGAGDND